MNEIVLVLGTIIIYFLWLWRKAIKTKWYKTREDGQFCKSCGAPTYIAKMRMGYNIKTGEAIEKDYRDCRNARYGFEVDDHPLVYDM